MLTLIFLPFVLIGYILKLIFMIVFFPFSLLFVGNKKSQKQDDKYWDGFIDGAIIFGDDKF
jgi:hypothetical protein